MMNTNAEQVAAKINGTIKHVRAGTKVGEKFKMMMRWAQVSAGTGKSIFEESRELVHLEGRWIKQLIKEMQKIRCKITIINGWIPTPHREHDK